MSRTEEEALMSLATQSLTQGAVANAGVRVESWFCQPKNGLVNRRRLLPGAPVNILIGRLAAQRKKCLIPLTNHRRKNRSASDFMTEEEQWGRSERDVVSHARKHRLSPQNIST